MFHRRLMLVIVVLCAGWASDASLAQNRRESGSRRPILRRRTVQSNPSVPPAGSGVRPLISTPAEAPRFTSPQPAAVPQPAAAPQPVAITQSVIAPEPEAVPQPYAVPQPEAVPQPYAVPQPEAVPQTTYFVPPTPRAGGKLSPPQTISVRLVLVQILKQEDADAAERQMASLNGPSDVAARHLAELEKSGAVLVANRLLLTTVSDQPCLVQCGERMPVITGRQMTRQGAVNAYQHEETGLMVNLTPRVLDEGVALKLEFERSWINIDPFQPADDSDNTPPVPPSVSTMTCQTNLVVGSNRTITAARMKTNAGENWTLLVSASRVAASDSP